MRLAVVCLLALTLSNEAAAHARSESYSNWTLSEGRIVAEVTVSTGEIVAIMDPDNPQSIEALLSATLATSVSVQSADGRCAADTPQELAAPRGFERMELRFDCGDEIAEVINYRALFDGLPAHVHFARAYRDGQLLSEKVITDHSDTWVLNDSASRHSFFDFLDLGVRHILAGIDHIAFLLGLLLIAGTPGRSVAAITGFTLGHSLSLGAAVLGYVSANGRLVEAFIGFTVALVAVEYFALRHPASRWLAGTTVLAASLTGLAALFAGTIELRALAAYLGFGIFALGYLGVSRRLSLASSGKATRLLFAVTTAFGLVHGFGFAGFLMDTGLTGDSLLVPLLGFNLGVEAGQLLLVAIAFVAAAVVGKRHFERLAPITAAALCSIGVFWFVGRSLAA